ncbi:MAG: TonB-dependent receptor, partial [Bacteroidetes bacterium]
MKKFLLFFLGLFFFCVFSGRSQSVIKGIIKDENDKVVVSATISLLQASDSAIVKFAISDKEGRYYFSAIKQGEYFIVASSAGFDKAYSSTFVLDKGAIDIPPLNLLHSKNILKNVTVTTSRPFIEMHLDKMVVNVEASPTNAGSNVLEVLAKSPAIIVDMDENISLNGKQGVLILIDGKNTYLTAKDLASLLKSMPAANIDQIEIMTNPPAKYEAEGMAGVINIKTKKNKNDGWNGSLSTGGRMGIFTYNRNTLLFFTPENNLNFNYKKRKINLFSSLGFSRWSGRSVGIYNKTYYTSSYDINGYTFFTVNRSYDGN